MSELWLRLRGVLRRRWRRLRAGARHRAHRRDAGLLRQQLTWFETYDLALRAFDLSLESTDKDVEAELRRLFLPLSASEMTMTAVAMGVLCRPKFMGSLSPEDIEVMRLDLVMHWRPEMER